jgi:hypothetical protein
VRGAGRFGDLREWWFRYLFRNDSIVGLARRLHPDVFYCAARCYYNDVPRDVPRHSFMRLSSAKSARAIFAVRLIGARRKNQMRSRYQPPKASGATSNPEFPSLRFFILYFLTLRIGRQGCPRAITMRPIPEHL